MTMLKGGNSKLTLNPQNAASINMKAKMKWIAIMLVKTHTPSTIAKDTALRMSHGVASAFGRFAE